MAERKHAKKGPTNAAASVALIPPIPRIPAAPRFPTDPRQAQAMRIISALARDTGMEMQLAGPNFVTGFHASAVDLGQLRSALGRSVARFNAAQIEERWIEIHEWMKRLLRAWVQRYKHVKIERLERGIRVELETQDDHGYYTYGVDVFPGGRPRARDHAAREGRGKTTKIARRLPSQSS